MKRAEKIREIIVFQKEHEINCSEDSPFRRFEIDGIRKNILPRQEGIEKAVISDGEDIDGFVAEVLEATKYLSNAQFRYLLNGDQADILMGPAFK